MRAKLLFSIEVSNKIAINLHVSWKILNFAGKLIICLSYVSMKKYFTLVMMMFMAGTMTVFADVDETFQFMDKDGNVIADGSEWVATEVENDGWADMVLSGLYVKNNSTTSNPTVKLSYTIETMPDGSSLQCCFPGNCQFQSHTGTYSNGPAPYNTEDLATEWVPNEGEPGECKVTFQLIYCKKKTFGDGYNELAGPTVHVTFKYLMGDEPSGIRSLETNGNGNKVYDLQGRELQNVPQRGIYIINGKKYVK